MASLWFRYPRLCSSKPRHLTPSQSIKASYTSLKLVPRPAPHKFHSQTRTMVEHAPAYRGNGDNGDEGSTEGEINAWKHRAPYRVRDSDPEFHVRYEASCHCGKIRYQLSREKPLAAKYCHCHTCQKLHGMRPLIQHLSAVSSSYLPGFMFKLYADEVKIL